MSRNEKAGRIKTEILKLADKNSELSINEIRVILALERIVARLSNNSILDKHLIYKGGFVLLKTLDSQRFTRDLDALGINLDQEKAEALVTKALQDDLDDGFWFGELKIEHLMEQGEYGALRFNCAYQIGDPPIKPDALKKLSRIHFDVGFGDVIPKNLSSSIMPTLLKESSEISWRVYPPEFIFSEKLETLVRRASANSRAKDLHDIAILFKQCNQRHLVQAISQTFNRRNTPRPDSFAKFAKNLDTRILETGWNAVRVADNEKSFKQTWDLVIKHLTKLDSLI